MRGDLDLDESLFLIWADDAMIGGSSLMKNLKVTTQIIRSNEIIQSMGDFYDQRPASCLDNQNQRKIKSIISQVWLNRLSSMTDFMLIIQSIFELLAWDHLHVSSGDLSKLC